MTIISIRALLVSAAIAGTFLAQADPKPAQPLVLGQTFTIDSEVLGEARRINVYRPPSFVSSPKTPVPVLYMPDGGMHEDFIHVAGLVQVSIGNSTMRPFLLVGIENTDRHRDMTGPTGHADDRKVVPTGGGSAKFRAFLRDELIPEIERRYRTTGERAIIGESLAGLFVVETLLLEPELFDTYISFDPSLWWNRESLVAEAGKRPGEAGQAKKTLFLATSREAGISTATERFVKALSRTRGESIRVHHEQMPGETHATIYHPAALRAFRLLFAPESR